MIMGYFLMRSVNLSMSNTKNMKHSGNAADPSGKRQSAVSLTFSLAVALCT